MFGKYFKHVLVLTLLAGFAYSLPQVKEGMVGAFSFSGLDEALVINYTGPTSTEMVNRNAIVRPAVMREQSISQAPERRMITPEEMIFVLYKAGVIPNDKLAMALNILKEQASSTKPFPPFATSTSQFSTSTEQRHASSSTTPPMIGNRDIRRPAGAPTLAPVQKRSIINFNENGSANIGDVK